MDMDIDIDIDPRISSMSYRELQAKCKELGLPGRGKTEMLRRTLDDYLKDPRETLNRVAKEATKKKKNGWIDWKNSAAKEILLEDLEPPKGWLYGVDNLDATNVYEYYKAKHKEIFEEVPFAQFETRYKEAIQKAAKRKDRSAEEEDMLKHDRRLHPRQTHNHRGEPVFDMDKAAKAQLKDDIHNKLHEQLSPMELWQSREVYSKYKLNKFRQRIYQYQRKVKFINWLERQRNEKRDDFAAARNPKEFTFDRNPIALNVEATKNSKIREANGQHKRSRQQSSGSRKRS